jgi:putative pyruvate formate lyase activating enzyme
MKIPSDNVGSFKPIVRRLWEMMNPCVLCPRNCRVNRGPSTGSTALTTGPLGAGKGETGFCGIGDVPVVSSVGPHFGEESVLVGRGGSGTIFFAGCNLGCVFCQNYDISHFRYGQPITISELADFMLDLQDRRCSNINFVTPTHVAPAVAAGIELARKKGLNLPTVYNSGGYDSVETLKLLNGYFDIYMPDMKFSESAAAKEFANAADYPEINFAAVKEMHRQVGDLVINENGLATRGLLVRHLVLPNKLAGSFKVIDFLAEQISPHTAINVMDQYRPCFRANSHPKINRRPTPEEIEDVRQYALDKRLNVIT